MSEIDPLDIVNEFTSCPMEHHPCPIDINDHYWIKKLCALAERCAKSENRVSQYEHIIHDPEALRLNIMRGTVVQPGGYEDIRTETVGKLREALESLRVNGHYECEDNWYSCPKHPDYCGEDDRDVCTCGTDRQNAIIDAALKGGDHVTRNPD
jgi:hypothetical protein